MKPEEFMRLGDFCVHGKIDVILRLMQQGLISRNNARELLYSLWLYLIYGDQNYYLERAMLNIIRDVPLDKLNWNTYRKVRNMENNK